MEPNTYAPYVRKSAYRGRKMRPGRYVAGPPRVFVSYCDHCHEKVLLPVEEIKNFGQYFKRESKSLKYKLYKYFASKLS